MSVERKGWRVIFSARLFSPQGLLLRAALLVVFFLIVHILGLREYTTILCGTSPSGNHADVWSSLLGVLYIVFWFGLVLGAPILALASGIFMLLLKLDKKTSR